MSVISSTDSGITYSTNVSGTRTDGHSDVGTDGRLDYDVPWEPPIDYQHNFQFKVQPKDQISMDTDSEDSNKYKSFNKLFARFAEKTSMQGVPYINSARLWHAKLIWTLLLVAAIGWMCFHLYYLVDQFLGWPKQTKIKLNFSNLEMPAVTICNVNPIRNSKVNLASIQLQELVNLTDPAQFTGDGNPEGDENLGTDVTGASTGADVTVSAGTDTTGASAPGRGANRVQQDNGANVTGEGDATTGKTDSEVQLDTGSNGGSVGVTKTGGVHPHIGNNGTDKRCNGTGGIGNDAVSGTETDGTDVKCTGMSGTESNVQQGTHQNMENTGTGNMGINGTMPGDRNGTSVDSARTGETDIQQSTRTNRTGSRSSGARNPGGRARGNRNGGVESGTDTSSTTTGRTEASSVTGTDENSTLTGIVTDATNEIPNGDELETHRSGRKKRFLTEFEDVQLDNFTDYEIDDFKANKNGGPKPPRDPVSRLEDTLQTLFMQERRPTRVAMGHSIRDMLISCSFDGYECYQHNFTSFQTPDYGNCFTIQSSTYQSKHAGPQRGLSVILFMENDEYLSGLTQGYGARIAINDQNTFPFPADEGFFVSSAFETHIGLKLRIYPKAFLTGENAQPMAKSEEFVRAVRRKVKRGPILVAFCDMPGIQLANSISKPAGTNDICIGNAVQIERLGDPYGECDDGVEFERQYGAKYTRQTCQILCQQNTVLEKCRCYENREVEIFYRTDRSHKFKACSTKRELKCQYEVLVQFEEKNYDCNCKNPCKEKQWIRSVSSRQWPTEQFANTLMAGLCQRRPVYCRKLREKASDIRHLSLNFLKFVVYYEDLNHEQVMEDPEIETAQFVSDIGGAMGLWIGLSILSLFEVVQLIIELCQYSTFKCKTKGDTYKEADIKFSTGERKSPSPPESLNFNQPRFARDYLYDGKFATARYQCP